MTPHGNTLNFGYQLVLTLEMAGHMQVQRRFKTSSRRRSPLKTFYVHLKLTVLERKGSGCVPNYLLLTLLSPHHELCMFGDSIMIIYALFSQWIDV
jgi:hypothetical protein